MGKALIIADGAGTEAVQTLLQSIGHDAMVAADLPSGWTMASRHKVDAVLLGTRIGDADGLALLPRLKQLPDAPEVLVMALSPDVTAAEFALRNGAWDYLAISAEAGFEPVAAALDQALQYREDQRSKTPAVAVKREKIIGNSPEMKRCFKLLGQSATSDANVLITGETGTGKELFARAIHSNSPRSRTLTGTIRSSNPRADKNFVVVDCAALPETLVESVLFGHSRGAFTGADRDHDGLIAQADGGTLFLDEVGELPLDIQRAFLRVLQERRYRPLGGRVERSSNFRLVAATNRNLDEMVEAGTFRKDLLFRLRTLTIELPPLRNRPEDIEELVRYHTSRLCESYGFSPKGFALDLMDALRTYNWPGNVRELINTIDGMLAAADKDAVLYVKHLPLEMRVQVVRNSITATAPRRTADTLPADVLPEFKTYRASFERQYLEMLMQQTGRNIPRACKASGISRSRLYEMLAKYRLNSPN
jgi:two-component system NtrC family response regulator